MQQKTEHIFTKLTRYFSSIGIGGSRVERTRRTPTPRRNPILSFSHTFSPKSARVGGRRAPPTNGLAPPQQEKPGSATDWKVVLFSYNTFHDPVITFYEK